MLRWKYFPLLRELPADCDDLAEILRALIWARPDAVRLCEPALRMVQQQQAPDGSFSTWIIDSNDTTAATNHIRQAVDHLWGNTADVEVMANLLEALHILDVDRAGQAQTFASFSEKALNYIFNAQHIQGYWDSQWYWGRFYGTLVCVRLIAQVWPGHPSLSRSLAFIEQALASDSEIGSLLSAAHALEALTVLGESLSVKKLHY